MKRERVVEVGMWGRFSETRLGVGENENRARTLSMIEISFSKSGPMRIESLFRYKFDKLMMLLKFILSNDQQHQ
ncbi:CLUMA_CG018602, isoform A [Clunio marinus]|uniref:CLUMA_CG018602, isoform A n=1 Tax=Clunio marinus TaxID=568069 RepID=A0A1J1IXN6_9DIPT|nr:CLUMA_CG018602, isoform A [Clunio marinus]